MSAVFSVGTLVKWKYSSAWGYGRISSVDVRGADHEHTRYNIEQFDNHVSETGSREPKIVRHWGSNLFRDPDARRHAREAADK